MALDARTANAKLLAVAVAGRIVHALLPLRHPTRQPVLHGGEKGTRFSEGSALASEFFKLSGGRSFVGVRGEFMAGEQREPSNS